MLGIVPPEGCASAGLGCCTSGRPVKSVVSSGCIVRRTVCTSSVRLGWYTLATRDRTSGGLDGTYTAGCLIIHQIVRPVAWCSIWMWGSRCGGRALDRLRGFIFVIGLIQETVFVTVTNVSAVGKASWSPPLSSVQLSRRPCPATLREQLVIAITE